MRLHIVGWIFVKSTDYHKRIYEILIINHSLPVIGKNGFLLLFCLILPAVGCTNEEYDDNVIVFAPDSLLIEGQGGIRMLDFLSSGTVSCEVTSPDEWITLHAGTIGRITSYELVVSGDPDGEKRYGTLTITQRVARKRVTGR